MESVNNNYVTQFQNNFLDELQGFLDEHLYFKILLTDWAEDIYLDTFLALGDEPMEVRYTRLAKVVLMIHNCFPSKGFRYIFSHLPVIALAGGDFVIRACEDGGHFYNREDYEELFRNNMCRQLLIHYHPNHPTAKLPEFLDEIGLCTKTVASAHMLFPEAPKDGKIVTVH